MCVREALVAAVRPGAQRSGVAEGVGARTKEDVGVPMSAVSMRGEHARGYR